MASSSLILMFLVHRLLPILGVFSACVGGPGCLSCLDYCGAQSVTSIGWVLGLALAGPSGHFTSAITSNAPQMGLPLPSDACLPSNPSWCRFGNMAVSILYPSYRNCRSGVPRKLFGFAVGFEATGAVPEAWERPCNPFGWILRTWRPF